MSYAHTTFVPSQNIPVTSLAYYSPSPIFSADATSSTYYTGPSFNCPSQEDISYQATPRRRTSDSLPYPTSRYDVTRSPTRTRFHVAHHTNTTPSHTTSPAPTRSRNNSSVLGPERHSRTYGRAGDPPAHSTTRVSNTGLDPVGPSNLRLVPQRIFDEPTSSKSHHYRYAPITFQLRGFPEIGVKVAAILNERTPVLIGDADPVFHDVQEREVRVQILWPGYSKVLFEKRVKTLQGKMARGSVAVQLAIMVIDFAYKIKETKRPIERGYEQWSIKTEHNDGIKPSDIFITRLIHCGGSHWQMELWAPNVTH
ncbi:hypothetical protein BDZ97DRAFT_1922865 [Flammula alnicola]|nr:hypothetical protein BDZ97DRAFT_1922865 [Flammula alnicola]